MGTDVHGIWQAKKDGKWVDVESRWDQERHYFLFSWLADVRNGFGFAGVKTYQPITPISGPRGYPEDFIIEDDAHPTSLDAYCERRREWMDEEEKKNPSYWMGDHSHSWLMADEILMSTRPDRTWRTGVVEREWFDGWDGNMPPKNWSGDITGQNVRVAESPVDVKPDSTHVRIYWKQSEDVLSYFVDEVKRLKELYGEVRLVFGFDS